MKSILRKPEFWVIALLVLLAAASVAEVLYINHTVDELCTSLDRVTNSIEAGGDARAAARDLENLWNQKRKIFGILIEHTEVDNIDEALLTFIANLRADNTDELSEHSARLEHYLRHVAALTDPALQNIF